jgi:hypothetical protein
LLLVVPKTAFGGVAFRLKKIETKCPIRNIIPHFILSMLRRSSRIATKYGPVYSNLPSAAAQRRVKRAARPKNVFALSKALTAALHDEDKKQSNPLQFTIINTMQFMNEWAHQRYVSQPVSGQEYSRVRITVSHEDHTGSCEDPELWRTERERYYTLYFTPFTEEDQAKPLRKCWTETVRGHEECGAQVRYTIHSVDHIVLNQDTEMSDSCVSM